MKKLLIILSIFLVIKTAFSQDNLKEYLNKADVFINRGDLNQALDILKTGKQKALSLSGENSAVYADFCEKTGLVYLYAKKYSDAKNLWIKTLVIRKKIYGTNHIKLSDSYNNLGMLYAETGDYHKSLKLHQNALKIREKVLPEDDMKIAASLMNMGRAYSKIGNPDFALKYFLKSLNIRKNKSDSFNPELADLFNVTAATYQTLGEYDQALKNYENVLLINEHNYGENHPKTAGIYADMAVVYILKGDYSKALEYNEKALEIFKEKYGEEHRAVAKILINIGTVYLKKNNIKLAVDNFNNSLEISKKLYETWNLKTAEQYTKIGLILNENSEHYAAENYFNNALKIQRSVLKSDNYLVIAESFLNIGNAYKDDEEYYSALEFYNKSLKIRLSKSGNKHPETARLYKLTASVYEAKRGYTAELKNLQKALISNIENFNNEDITVNPTFNKSNFYFDQKLVLETLNMKADAFWNLYLRTNNTDNLKEALKVRELSDLIIERIKKTALLKEDKDYLAENISAVYGKTVFLCIQLFKKTNESKYLNKALFYSEKNKQGIRLSLPEAAKYEGISDSVLNYETDLLADITYFKRKIIEDPNDIKSRTKLLLLYRNHNSFISDLKENHPKYYELKYEPISVKVDELQNLINDSTLVLDYFYPKSSKYMYVFSIRKNKTDMHFIKNIDDFNSKVLSFRKHIISKNEADLKLFAEEGYALYKELVPNYTENGAPIKQLVIIPDGNLGMIPFGALLTDEYSGNWSRFKEYPFLIKKYSVSYSLSANLLQKILYKDSLDNAELLNSNTFETVDSLYADSSIVDTLEIIDSTYMDDWLGVAPVFDDINTNKSSQRVREILNNTQNTFQLGTRTHFLNTNNISYLPESENEVRAIYNEFENSEKSPETETRGEADEEFFKLIDSEEFKYIHIATYAFVNSVNPEYSGILFAHNNTVEDDGVLLMNEFFDLKLNSDLIVLSNCETGIKDYRRGEGIIGFTGALLYTGTKNLIFSLWQVPGKSTEKLMLDFYKDILNKYNKPFAYSYSLQSAKLKLIEGGEYANPFYWSPFILIGN